MKRLINSALISLLAFVVIAAPASAAVRRYVSVDISKPATTANKTLNVQYTVLSTVNTDDFSVELFENSISKGSQSVTHANGNSGVFNISLPTTGTYSYKIVTTLVSGDSENGTTYDSKTINVLITTEPTPTVTTIAADTSGGGAAAGTNGSAQGAQGGAASGNTGTVTDDAASTTGDKDVLSDENKKSDEEKAADNRKLLYGIGLIALLAVGLAYMYIQRLKSLDD